MIRPRDRASAAGLLPRMEARPRKDGLVTYRYHPIGGKPVNLGTDKGAAISQVLDMNGRSTDEGTIGQLWRLYQESPGWLRLGDATKESYRQAWAMLAKVWEGGVVSAIKPADVARYLRVHRADAPVRANREVAVLSNLFNLAVERGDIERNPCREVRRNPEDPRTRLVEKAELQPFIDWALQQGDSAVVIVSMAEFAALTGNRRAEFRNLHWPQVDEELIRLQRAKGRRGQGKRELVAVSTALQAVLDRMKAAAGYNPMGPVFRAPRTGNPYTDRGFKAMWNRLVVAALREKVIAERFTFHDLRAHYTTYYKLQFGSLPEMHADPATTARVYERSREVRRTSL
ncbi:MAG: integrase family protein [Ramlibacter sp.]|jgi:integrase|nr:integrase family protein [Ramlibacter sp.]